MTKKEKEQHLVNLTDCAYTEATIECEKCHAIEGDYDDVILAEHVFSLGWRYIKGRVLCRKCVKKENKK